MDCSCHCHTHLARTLQNGCAPGPVRSFAKFLPSLFLLAACLPARKAEVTSSHSQSSGARESVAGRKHFHNCQWCQNETFSLASQVETLFFGQVVAVEGERHWPSTNWRHVACGRTAAWTNDSVQMLFVSFGNRHWRMAFTLFIHSVWYLLPMWRQAGLQLPSILLESKTNSFVCLSANLSLKY